MTKHYDDETALLRQSGAVSFLFLLQCGKE